MLSSCESAIRLTDPSGMMPNHSVPSRTLACVPENGWAALRSYEST